MDWVFHSEMQGTDIMRRIWYFKVKEFYFLAMWLCLVNSDMQGTNIMRIYQCSIQRERCMYYYSNNYSNKCSSDYSNTNF
jgi:hypothetical protein